MKLLKEAMIVLRDILFKKRWIFKILGREIYWCRKLGE